MAFRASNTVPQEAYRIVKGAAAQLKINLQAINATLAAGDVTYAYIGDIYATLERANDQFTALNATPGLAEYAKAQEDDPLYDVVAEFTAMQAVIADALTWMQGVPLNVTLKPITEWDSGSMVASVFTPAQTAGLRSELSLVIAAID